MSDLLGTLQREGNDEEPVFRQLRWERDQYQACLRLSEELVPWALGYSDPVRERVEAKKREASE